MPLFAVICRDKPGALQIRLTPATRTWRISGTAASFSWPAP